MIILSVIFGYAIRFVYFIIDIVLSFITGILKRIYCFIAYGENPFKGLWKPIWGFLKVIIALFATFVIWTAYDNYKINSDYYREKHEAKVEKIKTMLHLKKTDTEEKAEYKLS